MKRQRHDKQMAQIPKRWNGVENASFLIKDRAYNLIRRVFVQHATIECTSRIDWEARHLELTRLLDSHRKSNGNWDVVVPSSGGKDCYVAHQLKYKYGMNPLLVTWSPLQYTDIGLHNFNALCDSGFTAIRCMPDGIIHRKLARLCLEEFGDAFHVFVLGQVYFPIHMALKFGIDLVFYGENGEVEYAGDPVFVDQPYRDLLNDEAWLKGYMKGTTIDELIKYGVETKDYMKDVDFSKCDLSFYRPPSIDEMKSKNTSKLHFLDITKNGFLKKIFIMQAKILVSSQTPSVQKALTQNTPA